MATAIEVTGSRQGTDQQPLRNYRVFGATDELDAVATAVALSPSAIGSLPRADARYRELDAVDGDYDVTIAWGQPQTPNQETPVGSTEFRFNFQARGAHFNFSRSTVLYCTAAGCNAAAAVVNAPDFQQMLNVEIDDQGVPKALGFDVEPPPEVFSLSFKDTDANIDGAYQDDVLELVGTVNDTTFRTKPAGSVMLVRATGRRSGGLWNIDFGFGYVPNETNIPVGGITVTAKDGLDLLWAFGGATRDDDYFGTVTTPQAAFVERVWRRGNLNDLNLPV